MARGVIKSVLAEELKNSRRMKKEYEAALKELPKGSLSKKIIKGRPYYYLARREGDKVKYNYIGKLSDEEVRQYQESKRLRSLYRQNLSQAKKQICFLQGVLRGKEAI